MTIYEWLLRARVMLKQRGILDFELDPDWMVCEALNISRPMLRARRDEALPANIWVMLEMWLKRRADGEPLGYVLGNAHFMGHVFRSDARALIPRPETEILCERAMEFVNEVHVGRALDLCCGSGVIGLSIAMRHKDIEVTLADISDAALALANENAALHDVRVRMARGDLFEAVPGEVFDLIVCNPPYISEIDMKGLSNEVKKEPRIALFGGEDGLSFYRRIALALDRHLSDGGLALFEVGMGQADEVSLMMAGIGAVRVIRDLSGIQRIVEVYKVKEAV